MSVLALTALGACSDRNNGGARATVDGDDLSSLSGNFRIDGSSTVFPITQAAAEEFIIATGRNVSVDVQFSGTGGGFEAFCRGDTQVSDASRPIEEDEVQACVERGVVASPADVVEFQVAIDALTVMVNPSNDFIDCLTVQELHDLFKTDGASRWSDIRPEWPDESIDFYVPGTDSGTFDYFVEAIIEGVDEEATHRGDVTPSEDDNQLAIGIEGDEHAIGYFGFAYFLEAGQALKAVPIDNGDGCIEPSFEAALDGSYAPLSRPLFIYSTTDILTERVEVLQFIKFYLDNTSELVPQVGYVTMPDGLLQEQLDKLAPFLQ